MQIKEKAPYEPGGGGIGQHIAGTMARKVNYIVAQDRRKGQIMKTIEDLFYDYVSDTKQAEDFEETKEVEKTLYSYFKDFEHAEGFLDFENCLCKYSCVNEKQGFIKGFLYAGRLLGAALALNDEDAILVLRDLFDRREAGAKNADA